MRAVAVSGFKAPPMLIDAPKPTPGPGELLIHLGAASVNPVDWKIADGGYDGRFPHDFPLILGNDGAGVVEAVGEGVGRFKVGDGVYGYFLRPPLGHGTYAEFITAPETIALAPTPRGVYTAQAAAIPTAGMTALAALDAIGLKKGQMLLIFGAKGGIGSFATQLAANLGILVVTLSRGDHGTYLRKLGAFEYHDSGRIGYAQEVTFAHPKGVDAVLDLAPRGAGEPEAMAFVRDGGIYATPVHGGGTDAPRGIRRIAVDLQPKRELLDRLAAEISSGRLRVPVEMQAPLAEAPLLLEQSRAGATRGKAVILI